MKQVLNCLVLLTLLTSKSVGEECTNCVVKPLLTSTVQCPRCRSEKGCFSQDSIKEGLFSRIRCNPSEKYRSIDGSCNNLKHPTWGMANTTFSRIFPAFYDDGIFSMRRATNGSPLPLVRLLSTTVFPYKNNIDIIPFMAIEWGQFVSHDITLSPTVSTDFDCCTDSTKNTKRSDLCSAIEIFPNDRYFGKFHLTCINFVRTIALVGRNRCNHKIPRQLNAVTAILDGSQIYGSTPEEANNLRKFTDGLLRISTSSDGRVFLPLRKIKTACQNPNSSEPCFEAGDSRVNQNSEITTIQIMFLREHNRLARELSLLHPEWEDETLYQEARSAVIAEYQHITYNEWLPLLIGHKNMKKFNLHSRKKGHSIYNDSINPSTILSAATGALRIGHLGVPGVMSLLDYKRCPIKRIKLSDWMNRPVIVEQDENYDKLLLGLINEPMQQLDRYVTEELTNRMFHDQEPPGRDLISFDIMRGRDHGLPPYYYILNACTGINVKRFRDLQFINRKNLRLLKEIYKSVKDIDLFVGANLEEHVEGTRLGPTFLCLVTEQFYRFKFGDRFYYEVGQQPHSFSAEKLQQIKNTTLSRIICDNSDKIATIAPNSFLPISRSNQVTSCEKIGRIDLRPWN